MDMVFSPQSELVYQRNGNLWRIWRRRYRAGNLGETPIFKYDTNGFLRPPNSFRATIIRRGNNHIQLTGWKSHLNSTPFSFNEHSNTEWLSNAVTFPQDIEHIKTSIESGTALAVSDGSYLNTHKAGTAGWILKDGNSNQQIQGRLECPGSADAQCSHRSELAGILAVITNVNRLCKRFNILNGGLTIGCDGVGAIRSICNPYIYRSQHKHFDIVTSIKRTIAASPLHWQFIHIKGHQDDYTHFDDLSRVAQLNVLTDDIAKVTLTEMINRHNWNRQRPQHLPYETIEIYWRNKHRQCLKICSSLTKSLTRNIQTMAIRKYWTKKKKLSELTETYIDWTTSKKSRLGIDRNKHKWLCKWMTGFCGVGIMLRIYKHQRHAKCPRCLLDNEDTAHVLQCENPQAMALWTQSIDQLEQWMLSNAGHPELVELIVLGLTSWRNSSLLPLEYDILEPTLIQAYRKQRRIGWRSFIEGYWAIDWRLCQAAHFNQINSQKSSILWISRVQRKIWHIAWKMWEQRNEFLHHNGETIHTYEMNALGEEIQKEWDEGLGQLPPTYNHLFNGNNDI
jgi:hypothetical protein